MVVGRLDAGQLEHGGEDVDGVGELVADRRRRPPSRAGQLTMHGSATPPSWTSRFQRLNGRVAGHGPAPRVVVVGARAARSRRCAGASSSGPAGSRFCEADVVDRSVGPALGAGPVVRHQDDERVVEVAGLLEEVEQPAELGVGVGEEGGEALHEPGRHRAARRRQVVPGRHPGGPRRELGARGEAAPARAGGRRSPPARRPSPGRTGRGSARSTRGARGGASGRRRCRSRGRTAGRRRPPAGRRAELDGPVGQVGAQVVALLDRARRADRVVVVVEGGHELVGLAAVEPVPAVEAPAERPAVRGARPCGSRPRG